jgi:hypothetical protein
MPQFALCADRTSLHLLVNVWRGEATGRLYKQHRQLHLRVGTLSCVAFCSTSVAQTAPKHLVLSWAPLTAHQVDVSMSRSHNPTPEQDISPGRKALAYEC